MKPNTDQPKAPESKPGSKPKAKDDLKSLPMPELEKKLASSPEGLSQAEAQKRLTQHGPNECPPIVAGLRAAGFTGGWLSDDGRTA